MHIENAIIAYPSLFPSFSLLFQNNMGMVKRAYPSDWSTFSLVSHFPHPRFCFPFNSLYFIFPPHLSHFMLSFCLHFNVSLSLPFSPSIFHSLMLRGNSLAPLRGLNHHHRHPSFLSHFFTRTKHSH